jgi:hypothetical protein
MLVDLDSVIVDSGVVITLAGAVTFIDGGGDWVVVVVVVVALSVVE